MLLSRRLALAAPFLLAARPTLAYVVPGQSDRPVLEPDDSDHAVLRCPGSDQTITVPATRARIAAILPIAGREVTALAFGADGPDGRLDLLALAGWDGESLRLLGLEVLGWQGVDGSSLSSRFGAVGDRSALRVQRVAGARTPAAAGKPARTQWEEWTDLLAWQERAILRDASVRPGAVGSFQALLASRRAALARLLDPPCRQVTPEMVALAGFSRTALENQPLSARLAILAR